MENKQYRLNSSSSQRAVNEDTFDKIKLESKSNLLPIGETNKVINSGEQFNTERQDAKLYRLTGSFNTLFTNVLFNSTGTNSWASFNQNVFRDATFPPNNSVNDEEDLSYREAVSKYLTESNGWFGYYDPNPSVSSLCNWVDMEPNNTLFSMASKNLVKNWEVTVTYPASLNNQPGDFTHTIVNGGLLLIDTFQTVIGGRNMLTFATPVKHNLEQGDAVQLSGLLVDDGGSSLSPYNGLYSVIRTGKDNGDDKEYYFSVDIEETVSISNSSRMAKTISGRKSVYYVRVFKKVNTKGGTLIENDDYEIYPLAFGQTIYEDKAFQYVFNEDIDITDLTDNLNRPLSELYITVIKTDSNNTFTATKSGVKMPLFTNADSNLGLSDINRITNDGSTSHVPLNANLTIDDELFYGDVVEYNILEARETILGDVYHRFNTVNRENGGSVDGNDLGVRLEGYVYKPHHKIQIREYSNYVEQGTNNTLNRPSYSVALGDGRYLWRDLLDIGVNDTQETYLDYPFLNGSHYINSCISLPLLRQDPFNFYGLQWVNYPADTSGIPMEDNTITKTSQDVC
jgi:hypothetical protein